MRLILLTLSLMILLGGCSKGGDGGPPSPVPDESPAPTPVDSGEPYILDETTRSLIMPAVQNEDSPAAIECAVMLREDEACTFNDLPLLGMETLDPTIDDVMTRVLITHDWMGVRFRELLQAMPDEVLLMMRGVTAVVISSHVRPSFYTARTGAIYLDPAGMWLTEEEKAVISTREDPRSEDIRSFKFLMLWRYVQADTDIRALPRNIDSLALRTAALLYHELAHANDYFPPERLNAIDRTIPIYENISFGALPSTSLANSLPLQSAYMDALAAVAFNANVDPSPSQLEITAEEVAEHFPGDIANDYYNYYTDREDLAMAFEEAMMLKTLGIARDVAIVDYPGDVEFCDQLTVAWGQRSRIGEGNVGARSLFAVERILPEATEAIGAMVDSMPPPTQMTPGRGWCENITLDQGQAASRSLMLETEPVPAEGHVEFLVPWD